MANKRLTFDVSEELHARLKAEAAQLGIALGAHCASLLDNAGASAPAPSIEEIDQQTVYNLPLDTLRAMLKETADTKPANWSRIVTVINNEIRRRYRV